MVISYLSHLPLFEYYGILDIGFVVEAWKEPHRFYHTEKHLKNLLEQIEKEDVSEEEKKILQIAAFFHDLVYEPTSQENELKSAHKWKELVPEHTHTQEVFQIILDTKTHKPQSKLSEIFCKMDMAIVAKSSFKELLEWEKQIFLEYQCYDYSAYKAGRMAVLEVFRQQYPENASNLLALIEYIKIYRPKVGIYPGSFNPFHNGHLNILEKAEKIFDKVIIANGINPEKQGNDIVSETLSPVLRYRQVEGFKGLLTEYLASKETDSDATLIRGLRNGDDLSYEMNQLSFMRDMKADLKTIFIHCDREFEHISSSAIRNLEKIGKGYGEKYLP